MQRFYGIIWPPRPNLKRGLATTTALLFFLIVAVLVSSSWIDTYKFSVVNSINKHKEPPSIIIPPNCTTQNYQNQTQNYPIRTIHDLNLSIPRPTCPDYFRWIHEDLKPWKVTGITRDMVERAKPTAHFRLVILDGKVYLEKYKKSIQTRDVFTIWGILQLLRHYPGRLPDLELMFDCDDQPVIRSGDYESGQPNAAVGPPPLFRYCGDRFTLDIVFPDWSFWGWAEINIKPWEGLLKEIKEGNNKSRWVDREPYAYWKGNPFVAGTRQDLLKCNVSDKHDWNARLYVQVKLNFYVRGLAMSQLHGTETIDHLFLLCDWSWGLWMMAMNWWNISSCCSSSIGEWSEGWEGFCRAKPKSRAWKLVFYAIVWTIWDFRNKVVFKGNSACLSLAFDSVKFKIVWWFKHFGPGSKEDITILLLDIEGRCIDKKHAKIAKASSWCPPGENELFFNVDGAARGLQGPAGIGGVLRDAGGKVLCLFAESIGFADPSMAEMRAIHKAAMLIASSSINPDCEVTILSDSKLAVSWVNDEGFGNLDYINLVYDIRQSLRLRTGMSVKFSPRSSNALADSLAKEGLVSGGVRLEWGI